LFRRPFDRDGQVAASGHVLEKVVSDSLHAPFFRRQPPKTSGREEFGREFADAFIRRCGRAAKNDVVATATALTARSIAEALRRWVLRKRGAFSEFVVSGGGTNNSTLMAMLAKELQPLGLKLRFSDEFGLPAKAKEAVAFALLAYETWHRRPSNVVSATGAKHAAVLGKLSYPPQRGR
jgi:anhydro-N-acetylmuramic acid kinase